MHDIFPIKIVTLVIETAMRANKKKGADFAEQQDLWKFCRFFCFKGMMTLHFN
jgi:hypothetical protein